MAVSLKNVARKVWIDAHRLATTTCFNQHAELLDAAQRFREAVEAKNVAESQQYWNSVIRALGGSPWTSRYMHLHKFCIQWPDRDAFVDAVLNAVSRFAECEVLTKSLTRTTTHIYLRLRTNNIIQPIPETWHAATKSAFGDVTLITNLGKIDILLEWYYSSIGGISMMLPVTRYVLGTGDGRVSVSNSRAVQIISVRTRDNPPHYHTNHVNQIGTLGNWWGACLGDFEELIVPAAQTLNMPRLVSLMMDFLHSWGPHGLEHQEHPWRLTKGVLAATEGTAYRILDQYCSYSCGHTLMRAEGFCSECKDVGCTDVKHDARRVCVRCKDKLVCAECASLRPFNAFIPTFQCYGPCQRGYLCQTHVGNRSTWFCQTCEKERIAKEAAVFAAQEKAKKDIAEAKKAIAAQKKSSKRKVTKAKRPANPIRRKRKANAALSLDDILATIA